MRLCFFIVVALAQVIALVNAQDRAVQVIATANSSTQCHFAVALPELDGPLTLGIFSPDGKLVRLLYHEALVNSIPAGLNGLLISWDGKDDHGMDVQFGIYDAMGLVHGNLGVSAMPTHDDGRSGILYCSNNDILLTSSWGPAQSLFCSNKIVVQAAPDALFENRERPFLVISASLQGGSIAVYADGLPLLKIPLEAWMSDSNHPTLEFQSGLSKGMGVVKLNRPDGIYSWMISGLDHLVPMNAGALPMPPEKY